MFGKSSFLDLEPSTMIQTSYHFSPLLMFEFGSMRQCQVWLSLENSIGEFSMVYITNECSDMA